jgi:hypothetical protein
MRSLFFIAMVFCSFEAYAQHALSRELDFIQHLIHQEAYEDAIYYINRDFRHSYPMPFRDSLNYFRGWSQYAIRDLDPSAAFLLQVSSDSPLFFKSRFFAAYNYSHLGKLRLSESILQNLKTRGRLSNLRDFQLGGIALLSRDTQKFTDCFRRLETVRDFAWDTEKKHLEEYHLELLRYRKKSMVAGVFMSALVPGAGKIYAGKTGEGISAFLIVAATGAAACENYRKLGPGHAKTILFGSLFAVLYLGNIYGTLFTVKLANEEFNHEMDQKILFNMHIPLRNFFN